jgi:hypothetical protein
MFEMNLIPNATSIKAAKPAMRGVSLDLRASHLRRDASNSHLYTKHLAKEKIPRSC